MEILISRLSALGDTVCSLPAAVALKKTFPESRITWVVDPRFASVVECCSSVDEVIQYKPKLSRPLRLDRKFDFALDLQGLMKSAWPVLWAKADQKLGYHWQREGASLVTQKVLPDPTSLHVVDQYVDVARAAGAVADRAEFNLTPNPEAVLSVRAKLKGKGIGGRFVVLNPSAGWASKRWPPSRFAELIDLIAGLGVSLVLIGGRGDADRQTAAGVLEHCKSQVGDLTGETSIHELIALIRLGSAHVGGDTGSSHIAAALDVPAVGLYGITNPVRSCPYGQRDRCHYAPNGLQEIPATDVFRTVERSISQ